MKSAIQQAISKRKGSAPAATAQRDPNVSITPIDKILGSRKIDAHDPALSILNSANLSAADAVVCIGYDHNRDLKNPDSMGSQLRVGDKRFYSKPMRVVDTNAACIHGWRLNGSIIEELTENVDYMGLDKIYFNAPPISDSTSPVDGVSLPLTGPGTGSWTIDSMDSYPFKMVNKHPKTMSAFNFNMLNPAYVYHHPPEDAVSSMLMELGTHHGTKVLPVSGQLVDIAYHYLGDLDSANIQTVYRFTAEASISHATMENAAIRFNKVQNAPYMWLPALSKTVFLPITDAFYNPDITIHTPMSEIFANATPTSSGTDLLTASIEYYPWDPTAASGAGDFSTDAEEIPFAYTGSGTGLDATKWGDVGGIKHMLDASAVAASLLSDSDLILKDPRRKIMLKFKCSTNVFTKGEVTLKIPRLFVKKDIVGDATMKPSDILQSMFFDNNMKIAFSGYTIEFESDYGTVEHTFTYHNENSSDDDLFNNLFVDAQTVSTSTDYPDYLEYWMKAFKLYVGGAEQTSKPVSIPIKYNSSYDTMYVIPASMYNFKWGASFIQRNLLKDETDFNLETHTTGTTHVAYYNASTNVSPDDEISSTAKFNITNLLHELNADDEAPSDNFFAKNDNGEYVSDTSGTRAYRLAKLMKEKFSQVNVHALVPYIPSKKLLADGEIAFDMPTAAGISHTLRTIYNNPSIKNIAIFYDGDVTGTSHCLCTVMPPFLISAHAVSADGYTGNGLSLASFYVESSIFGSSRYVKDTGMFSTTTLYKMLKSSEATLSFTNLDQSIFTKGTKYHIYVKLPKTFGSTYSFQKTHMTGQYFNSATTVLATEGFPKGIVSTDAKLWNSNALASRAIARGVAHVGYDTYTGTLSAMSSAYSDAYTHVFLDVKKSSLGRGNLPAALNFKPISTGRSSLVDLIVEENGMSRMTELNAHTDKFAASFDTSGEGFMGYVSSNDRRLNTRMMIRQLESITDDSTLTDYMKLQKVFGFSPIMYIGALKSFGLAIAPDLTVDWTDNADIAAKKQLIEVHLCSSWYFDAYLTGVMSTIMMPAYGAMIIIHKDLPSTAAASASTSVTSPELQLVAEAKSTSWPEIDPEVFTPPVPTNP